MAIRRIVKNGDKSLRTVCRPVEKFDEKLHQLLDDMTETLYKANGSGLAAPQIGILKRICVIDVGEGLIECINPVILKASGKQRDVEGCLSCPNVWGYVVRPQSCRLRAQNRYGEFYEMNLKDLFCRCAHHEIDHLDGKLFIDKVDQFVHPQEDDENNN